MISPEPCFYSGPESDPLSCKILAARLVVPENDGITVRQTVAHTIQLWPRGLSTPYGSCLSRRKAQWSVLSLSQAASMVALAHTIQQQLVIRWGIYNSLGLNKNTNYITKLESWWRLRWYAAGRTGNLFIYLFVHPLSFRLAYQKLSFVTFKSIDWLDNSVNR